MRQAVILCGTASLIMGFLGGVVGSHLMAPLSATAQSIQVPEVRASACEAWVERLGELGFAHVEAGPLVRSSYHAGKQLQRAVEAGALVQA